MKSPSKITANLKDIVNKLYEKKEINDYAYQAIFGNIKLVEADFSKELRKRNEPPKESMDIRSKKFYNSIVDFQRKNDPLFKDRPKWVYREFYEHWETPLSKNSKYMKFEDEKTWNLSQRISTWTQNSKRFYPEKWKETQKPTYKPPVKKSDDYDLPLIDYNKSKQQTSESKQAGNIGKILTSGERLKNKLKSNAPYTNQYNHK